MLYLDNFAETFLPDRLRYIPRRKDSYTAIGFRGYGYLNTLASGWEVFVWQGVPFGFHMRRWTKDRAELGKQKVTLARFLGFLGR